jgi:hypothetical protein
VDKVPAPREVVAALQRHFLGAADPELRRGAGAGGDAEAERILCARAMAALYHAHAAAVGALPARTLAGARSRARQALLWPGGRAAARENVGSAHAAGLYRTFNFASIS